MTCRHNGNAINSTPAHQVPVGGKLRFHFLGSLPEVRFGDSGQAGCRRRRANHRNTLTGSVLRNGPRVEAGLGMSVGLL